MLRRLIVAAAGGVLACGLAAAPALAAPAHHHPAARAAVTAGPDASCDSGYDVWQNTDGYWLDGNGNGNPVETGTNSDYCWKTAAVGDEGEVTAESGLCLGEYSDGAGTELQTCIGTKPQVWELGSEGNGTFVLVNEWSFDEGLIGDLAANNDADGSYVNADSATTLRYWQR